MEAAVEKFVKIDVMLNNAGLMQQSPLERLKIDDWDRMIDVNIKGVVIWNRSSFTLYNKIKIRTYNKCFFSSRA